MDQKPAAFPNYARIGIITIIIALIIKVETILIVKEYQLPYMIAHIIAKNSRPFTAKG